MRAALSSARLGEKLARMKESKEIFDYNLLDFEHPDFRKVEQKCIPVQGLSESLSRDIMNLKVHCELSGRVCLAANQIGLTKRIIAMAQPEYAPKRIWLNHQLTPEKITTIINPKIVYKEKLIEDDWEETACFPTMRFIKSRFYRIFVTYQNENLDLIEEELSGWRSRLFQQGLDQLNGIIPFDEIKNMLNSDLIPEYQDPTIPLSEFEEAKIYRLFGKERLEHMGQKKQQQFKGGFEDITETIHDKNQKNSPLVSPNKAKRNKSSDGKVSQEKHK